MTVNNEWKSFEWKPKDGEPEAPEMTNFNFLMKTEGWQKAYGFIFHPTPGGAHMINVLTGALNDAFGPSTGQHLLTLFNEPGSIGIAAQYGLPDSGPESWMYTGGVGRFSVSTDGRVITWTTLGGTTTLPVPQPGYVQSTKGFVGTAQGPAFTASDVKKTRG
jgi:hypothetical protein